MGIEEGVYTKEKVTCSHCIEIVLFCRQVKLSELQ